MFLILIGIDVPTSVTMLALVRAVRQNRPKSVTKQSTNSRKTNENHEQIAPPARPAPDRLKAVLPNPERVFKPISPDIILPCHAVVAAERYRDALDAYLEL